MFDKVRTGSFDYLPHRPYLDDFNRNFGNVGNIRKLERGQNFNERGFASWEAFAAGDWNTALALADERRDAYVEFFKRPVAHRRLRVVEFPVTPYVQWEMQVLRLRVELGEQIRVLDTRTIVDVESDAAVPEIVILGDKVLYQVLYESGDAAGARRFTDPALVSEALADFDVLFARGEAFVEFFDREIRPLPPPAV
jgi:hypothetical protein